MSSLYHPVNLGAIKLAGNIFLAPMAGYSDINNRHIALKWGAALAFTEMVSTEALWRVSEKSNMLMHRDPDEKNLAIQLFGSNIESIEKSIPYALVEHPAIIDFNCGCPVPKINRSGSGSALMKNPKLIGEIVQVLRRNTPRAVAITIKFRTGWSDDSINYLDVADQALSNGADMISMHARTRSQGYSGSADWRQLADLKRHFPQAIVCGSGDLMTPEDVKRMFEETGLDAVMIARGSIGNPFIFKQSIDLLTRGHYQVESTAVKWHTALGHLKLALSNFEEEQAVREIKKHLMNYVKGLNNASLFKQRCALMQSKDEALQLFNDFMPSSF